LLPHPDDLSGAVVLGAIGSVLALPIGALATALIAFPMLRWLMRRGKLSATTSIASGLVVAAILCAVVALTPLGLPIALVEIAVAGPLAALAFWLVVKRPMQRQIQLLAGAPRR
jgi:hypothetical protein